MTRAGRREHRRARGNAARLAPLPTPTFVSVACIGFPGNGIIRPRRLLDVRVEDIPHREARTLARRVALFGLFAHGLALSLALVLVVGYLIFGSMVGLYSILPSVYPTEVRSARAGLSVGVGRIGAIVSPFVAGVLLESGWSGSSTYVIFALPLLAAGAASFFLERLLSSGRARRPAE